MFKINPLLRSSLQQSASRRAVVVLPPTRFLRASFSTSISLKHLLPSHHGSSLVPLFSALHQSQAKNHFLSVELDKKAEGILDELDVDFTLLGQDYPGLSSLAAKSWVWQAGRPVRALWTEQEERRLASTDPETWEMSAEENVESEKAWEKWKVDLRGWEEEDERVDEVLRRMDHGFERELSWYQWLEKRLPKGEK